MPLRDHFHPPLKNQRHWEGIHSLWAGVIVQHLIRRLPSRYYAEPRTYRAGKVDFPAEDVFEVQVYDEERGTHLVAAVEFVSPANKDRPESRRSFAIKCAAYLQQQVSVVIVDVVTDRHSNLHGELLRLLSMTEPAPWPEGTHFYAAAYRTIKDNDRWRMEVWPEQLALGAALPTLPLWLASNLSVPLDLEATYEETCQVLRIR